jgi:hypothetical protein
MVRARSTFAASLLIALLASFLSAQQTASVPTTYSANTSRTVIPEPPLPALGPAGSHFNDPAFGSRILRVTDPNTRPGSPGRSYVTASAAHQLAWNASSDRFWIRGVDGVYSPYNFNASTMTATRINPTSSADGGLTIVSQLEPQFSFVSPNILFGTRQTNTTNHPVIRKFDFNTLTYSDIVDLSSIDPSIPNPSYARALAGSAAAPEKLSLLYGGAAPSQDLDFRVAVFQVGSPTSTAAVLDSLASTIRRGGTTKPTTITLGFRLHHQWIDLSGRYVLLYPINGSFPSPMPYFIWDQNTDAVTKVTKLPGGHDALGYGWQVNQDCCTTTAYDGAQWQLRPLANPTQTSDLINPVLSPEVLMLGEHTSWNNAQPGTLVPILSSLYRIGSPFEGSWRAWDYEIIAIQTNNTPAGATVWRFAHHRSDVSYDGDTSQPYYFWYLPRAMISPDGRFAMFTSNWEKTLGSTAGPDVEPGGAHRCDVFIVSLVNAAAAPFTDDPLVAHSTFVKAVHITELRSRIDALRARFHLAAYAWTDPSLGAGTVIKAAHIADLREALRQAYVAAGRAAPAYTDPTVTPTVTVIKAVHIQELRSAVVSLESN